MRLQRLVSDESHATVGAFELDSFVELRDRNYVVTIENKTKNNYIFGLIFVVLTNLTEAVTCAV